MRAKLWRLRVLLPIGVVVGLLIAAPANQSVRLISLTLIAFGSKLAGRELATFVPLKVAIAASVLVWAGVAYLYASGVIERGPSTTGYVVYVGLLFIGAFIPASMVFYSARRMRKVTGE